MRFYNQQHNYYCGIDLHTKTMYVCILNQAGDVLVHQNIPVDSECFSKLIMPYLDDIVVCVECIFTWYWIADFCNELHIPFVLGHALYMKAIHGSTTKNSLSRCIAGIKSTHKKSHCCYVVACSPWLTSIRHTCDPHVICCAAGCTSCTNDPNFWRISRIRKTSIICLTSKNPLRGKETANMLLNILRMTVCKKVFLSI